MKRSYLQIILAGLLLIAQHGAVMHQMQHAHGQLSGVSSQTGGGKSLPQSDLCDFHAAFIQVLGIVNSAADLPLIAVFAAERTSVHFTRQYPSSPVIPASRGPPILL